MECWIATCYRERLPGSVYCTIHNHAPRDGQPPRRPQPRRHGQALREVAAMLAAEGRPMYVSEIAARQGVTSQVAFRTLQRLIRRGLVRRTGIGVYEAAAR